MTNTTSKSKYTLPAILAALIFVPLLAASVYFATRPKVELADDANASPANSRNRTIVVGGVPRSASDFGTDASAKAKKAESKRTSRFDAIGLVNKLAPDVNENVASVYESATEQRNGERLSPLIQGKPFDRASYEADPESYLAVHEPGRIWQSAQPGPDVPLIQPEGKRTHTIKQGESVRLSVTTEPKMPVTYTSFDLGTFSNGLASITVAANDQGVANATFSGSSGTAGQINILAASPAATGRIKFNVFVLPPARTVTGVTP